MTNTNTPSEGTPLNSVPEEMVLSAVEQVVTNDKPAAPQTPPAAPNADTAKPKRSRRKLDPNHPSVAVCKDVVAAFAAQLKDAREAAGLTQAALAEAIGTAQPVISRVESGEDTSLSIQMLCRIAWSLGLDVSINLSKPAGS